MAADLTIRVGAGSGDARGARCPYCRDSLGDAGAGATCLRCRLRVHDDCAELLLRCPTFGCGGALARGTPSSLASGEGAATGASATHEPDGASVVRPRRGGLGSALRRSAALTLVFSVPLVAWFAVNGGPFPRLVLVALAMGGLLGLVALPVALVEALADRFRSRVVHGLAAALTWPLVAASALGVWVGGVVVDHLARGRSLDGLPADLLRVLEHNPGPSLGAAAFSFAFAAAAWGRLRRLSLLRQVVTATVASGIVTLLLQGGVQRFDDDGDVATAVMTLVAGVFLPLAYRLGDRGALAGLADHVPGLGGRSAPSRAKGDAGKGAE